MLIITSLAVQQSITRSVLSSFKGLFRKRCILALYRRSHLLQMKRYTKSGLPFRAYNWRMRKWEREQRYQKLRQFAFVSSRGWHGFEQRSLLLPLHRRIAKLSKPCMLKWNFCSWAHITLIVPGFRSINHCILSSLKCSCYLKKSRGDEILSVTLNRHQAEFRHQYSETGMRHQWGREEASVR